MKATEILMQEHRLIEQVLDCLEDAAGRLEDGDDIDPDFFIDAAEFVAGFADGSHHRKEEDILFVAMTANDVPGDTGPVAVMLHEHEQGRQFTAGFRLLREHIIKEDNVLFPMADQVITGDDMVKVSKQFEEAVTEDENNGEITKYQALAEKLSTYLSMEAEASALAAT